MRHSGHRCASRGTQQPSCVVDPSPIAAQPHPPHVQVNPLASQVADWAPRVQRLHAQWAPLLLDRDSDISPVMFCASLLPGVWQKAYRQRLEEVGRRAAAGEE